MRMEYENGALRIENAAGRQWQLPQVEKPGLSFAYDALSVTGERALRRLGGAVHPLTRREVDEVTAFVERQTPPSLNKQLVSDLKQFSHGLINAGAARFGFDNLLQASISAREDSLDQRASEAQQVLAFVDVVWNAYYALAARIEATAEAELKPFKDYVNMMPMAPAPSDLKEEVPREALKSNGASHHKHEPDVAVSVAQTGNANTEIVRGLETAPEHSAGRAVHLQALTEGTADFTNIVDRAFVFDNVVSPAQLRLFEDWALKSPHWMLANSSHSKDGTAKHRIWGASFIESWRRDRWAGLPPVLFSMIAVLFKKLEVTIFEPEYIGLNGQSRDQLASMHTDCEDDSADDLSILFYLGERTDGDLLLYDKTDHSRLLHRIAFKPNRVVAFDGSIPHQALAPTDDRFRMSLIVRGKYRTGFSELIESNRQA
jgi:hypothetical protein